MTRIPALALGWVLLAGSVLAQETPVGDPSAGRDIAAGKCRTCHGLDGYARIVTAPHIAGEPVGYLTAQLTAFRDGAREHELMSVVARQLTDRQIVDVASWYASHAVTTVVTAPAEDSPELCSNCHGVDGLAVVGDAPHLAGEANIYIETQLKAYRSGKRFHVVMSEIAADLTNDEMREISNWFAAVELRVGRPE
ncbi:MAG: c-type cytochrome [Rhodobacter sp.]|nr:c-type cytochrome [Rhodobacter sp.]MCY4240839.1 c-type cytochrome [Rhodobacter sp.]